MLICQSRLRPYQCSQLRYLVTPFISRTNTNNNFSYQDQVDTISQEWQWISGSVVLSSPWRATHRDSAQITWLKIRKNANNSWIWFFVTSVELGFTLYSVHSSIFTKPPHTHAIADSWYMSMLKSWAAIDNTRRTVGLEDN